MENGSSGNYALEKGKQTDMKKRLEIFSFLVLIPIVIAAQTESSYDDFKKRMQSAFNSFKSEKQSEYDAYRKKVNPDFITFLRHHIA